MICLAPPFRRLAVVLAILLPHACLADKPSIFCENVFIDLGRVFNDRDITHFVQIKNVGDAPLRISHVNTCCGARAVLVGSTNEIPANGAAEIKVTILTKGRSGSLSRIIHIASNDPLHPTYRLLVKAEAVPIILIDPPCVTFTNAVPAAELSATVRITTTSSLDFPTQAVSSVPWLAAVLGANGHRGELVVKTIPPHPDTTTNAFVTLLGQSGFKAAVPVTLTRRRPVAVFPEQLTIAPTHAAEKIAPRFFAVKSTDGRPFAITAVTCPAAAWKVESTRISPSMWRVGIDGIDVADVAGGHVVTLETDHPDVRAFSIPVVLK